MAREVDLVIRAKNEATKAIDSIKEALKELAGSQERVGQSAREADGLLGALGKQLNQLNAEARGISALGKAADYVDRTAAAVGKLDANVARATRTLSDLNQESQRNASATANLKTQAEAAAAALLRQEAATKAAKKAQSDANAEMRRAQSTLTGLENKVAKSKTPPSEDLLKQVAAQRQLVAAVRESQGAAANNFKAQVAAQDALRGSLKSLDEQLKASEAQERRIAASVAATTTELTRQQGAVAAASQTLSTVTNETVNASAGFRGLSLTQEGVARASADVARQLAIVQGLLDRQKTLNAGPRDISTRTVESYKAQIEVIKQAKAEYENARATATRLGAELARAATPTAELARAFEVAKVKASQAQQAFENETVALSRLRGAASSTFAEFSRARTAAPVDTTRIAEMERYTNQLLRMASELRRVNAEAARTSTAMGGAARSTSTFSESVRSVGDGSRQSLSLIQRLRGEILSLTATFIGFHAALQGIGSVIDAFRTLEAAQNRLGAVFDQNTAKIDKEIQFLRATADRLGITFGVLADEYAKFAIAADAANFSASATRKIFISVAEAGRVNKLSVDQLQGTFLALQQMISKGKVSSEELSRQLGDRLPGAVNIFANALGVSVAELTELLKKGEVFSTQTNMLKFADELNKRFGPQLQRSLQSTTTEMGRFQNSLFNAALSVAAGGFIESFTELLRKMNVFFASKEGNDFFLSLGAALGTAVDILAFFVVHLDKVKLLFQFFISYKIAGIFLAIAASFRATAAASTATAASLAASRGSLTATTGAVGGLRGALLSLALAYRATAIEMQATSATTRASIIGMTAMRGGLMALGGIVRGAAIAFRGLWAAIGGLPGLILTGVTIAIASWAGSVRDTTAAIEEHKRIMASVIEAYETVKGTTKEWSAAIKNVTLAQAVNSAKELKKQYEAAIQAAITFSRTVYANTRNPDDTTETARRQADNIEAALQGLESGSLSIANVIKLLNQIALNPATEEIRSTAVALLDMVNTSKEGAPSIQELSRSFQESQAVISVFGKNVDDATKAVLTGTNAVESFDAELAKATKEGALGFNKALDEINKNVPELVAEIKRVEALDALEGQYQQALKLARTIGQATQAVKDYNSAKDSINTGFNNTIAGSFTDKVVGVESSGNPNAKNPDSTATGLGQFISSTWLRMFKQYFPDRAASLSDAAILALRKNSDDSKAMVELYAQENAAVLQKAGKSVTDANLYLSHFLGSTGAVKVLNAAPETPLKDILSPQVMDSNKSLLEGKTAAELVAWSQKKMGITTQELAVVKEIKAQEEQRVEKQSEFNSELQTSLKYKENEVANNGKLTKEMFVQKALDEARAKAKEAETTLDAATEARIKAIAAAEYDRTNAIKEGKDATAEANTALATANAKYAQRTTLIAALKAAEASGDQGRMTTLTAELGVVNENLTAAIEKARAMWEEIGGPKSVAAIAKLDTLKVKINTATTSMGMFGLSADNIKTLVGSFADGIVGVFDSFAQAIANGENAFKALGRAFIQFAATFLREIATMILKQLILNALAGFGGPIGLAAKGLGGTAHSGGVVGSKLTGVGNATRRVSPAVFAAAMHYQTGGIAGLKPDEVPTILHRNEEVLTAQDSRHRGNGGLMQGGNPGPIAIRNILTLDPEFARSMMSSTDGEKATMATVRKNKATLKQMLREK